MTTAPLDPLRAALADRYRLERELGQGGMATVYLAHDLRHERKVAIKVLRPDLAAVIGAERFVREIRTIAALQHPHILGLIDSGEVQGTAYYVMPFVEGESLRDRLVREKQLPVADAVRIATEVASALDYAHRHGVIHRDIKPENILLHDGQALVADFGIALAMTQAGGTRMTETGMSLGTPYYMSPEQAMGEREITARSDVYALGAVLYEMLSGEPPFTGPTAQAIVAKVMTDEPRPLRVHRKTVPPYLEDAVLTALAKLPADRFDTAKQFAEALASEQPTRVRTAVRPAARVGRRRSWVPTALLAAALGLLAGVILGRGLGARSDGAPAMIRATLHLGDSAVIRPVGNIRLAIAPTGRRVAFIGSDGPDPALWVRELDQPSARRLPDTRGAFAPFFSPDGESIGFFTGAEGSVALKIVPAAGGVARTVAKDSVASFGGADWSDDGRIYFTNSSRGLSRVDATGGKVSRVAYPDSAHGVKELDYPDVLPGGQQAFVMMWKGSIGSNSVGVVDLGSGAVTELAEGSYARYLSPGLIAIGAAGGRILVSRYEPGKRRLADTPALVLEGVQDDISNGTVEFAVAENGTLVYQPGQEDDVSVVWVDRSGRDVPVDTTLKGDFSSATLSPDGSQIALARSGVRGSQIWVKQLRTGAFSPISQELRDADRPVWSPDGRSVAFLATRDGHRRAWIRRADGSELDEIAFDRSGRYTLFRSEGSAVGTRYLLLLEKGDSLPRALVRSRYDNFAMTLSPDGRWMAYVSDESGNPEVYVRPFPAVDSAKFAVSIGGGVEPLWRRDGAELFFRTPRGDMYVVTVGPGRQFEHGAPRLLFARPGMALQEFYRSYDVHPDGKRFLMLKTGDAEARDLNVIFNWRPALQSGQRAAR
jgi:Tol biopolymer transport system component/tRNA A-37 threonylcarbamoyl transferase component Bud32